MSSLGSRSGSHRRSFSAEDGALLRASIALNDGAVAGLAVAENYPHPTRLQRHIRASSVDSRDPVEDMQLQARPWWRRPSMYWMLPLTFLRMLTISMQMPVYVDIITRMACAVHRPDIAVELHVPSTGHGLFDTHSIGTFDDAPSNHTLCARDPHVQQAVSSVLATLTSITGLLTMLTSAWWGQKSDLWGRTRLLTVAVVALAASELNMIFVARSISWLPGKAYWFLVPGAVIVGVLGGGSGTVPTQAYLADVTSPQNRASIFSFWGGTAWIAIAVGPIISAQLIKLSPTGSLLNVYYASLAVNVILFIIYICIMPESLSDEDKLANRARWEGEREKLTAHPVILYLRDLVAPLSVVLPRPREDGRRGLDWNMTYTIMAYSGLVVVSGGTVYIVQLMQADFGWDSVKVGYWASALGLLRAIYLLVVLPALLTYFRPKPDASHRLGTSSVASDESDSLLPTSASVNSNSSDEPVERTPAFDLAIVRWSLFGDGLSYLGMLLAQTVNQFVVVSMGLTFGGGMMAAFMSLGLALSPTGAAEGGKLFGAFGFFTSLGSEVLGQWLLGGISYFFAPRAMLFACSIILAASFTLTLSIRLSPSVSRRASYMSQQ